MTIGFNDIIITAHEKTPRCFIRAVSKDMALIFLLIVELLLKAVILNLIYKLPSKLKILPTKATDFLKIINKNQ